MKKVSGSDYLYQRGGTFYFRRSVPKHLRHAFGCREFVRSLNTSDRSIARHSLGDQLRRFEAEVARADGSVAPIERTNRQPTIPTQSDIEATVRDWLEKRRSRAGGLDSDRVTAEQEVARASELEDERQTLEMLVKGTGEPLGADWVVAHIIQDNHWEVDEESGLYRSIRRLVLRGMIEANDRWVREFQGKPVRNLDERFSSQSYLLDHERNANKRQPCSLMALIDGYVKERKPAPSTTKAYKRDFLQFCEFIGHDDANRVTARDVVSWKDELHNRGLAPKTISDKSLVVLKSVFGWAEENQLLESNPAEKVRVRRPRAMKLRDRDFTDAEAGIILRATLEEPPKMLSHERSFARRWVPWLCAYSGARVNEITQLRAEDVKAVDGIPAIRITPEAGRVKSHEARVVPLHPHLLEQGFLSEIAGKDGPLFYDTRRHRGGSDANPQFRKVGEHLARWVREIGVDDPNVQPNHGWRHRFSTVSRTSGIPQEVRRAIMGHSPSDVSAEYGSVSLELMYAEISKIPKYNILKSGADPF